jgi:ribosomal protein L19
LEVLNYFKKEKRERVNVIRNSIYKRKRRERIKGFYKSYHFSVGDIIKVIFLYNNIPIVFTGICIGVKKKGFIRPDTSFILRNVIWRIGIEFIVSYYYNRTFKLEFLDYRRKAFIYRRSKLYYLRHRLNKESKV